MLSLVTRVWISAPYRGLYRFSCNSQPFAGCKLLTCRPLPIGVPQFQGERQDAVSEIKKVWRQSRRIQSFRRPLGHYPVPPNHATRQTQSQKPTSRLRLNEFRESTVDCCGITRHVFYTPPL